MGDKESLIARNKVILGDTDVGEGGEIGSVVPFLTWPLQICD